MKRGDRESGLTAADKAAFLDLCVELAAADRKAILKKILQTKYTRAAASGDRPSAELPSTLPELINADPSSSQFIDYAYTMCSMENQISRDDLVRTTLAGALDAMLSLPPPRKSKRHKARKLPTKLSPFVLNEGTADEQPLRSFEAIVDEFFPEMESLFPCVYADSGQTSFVLFVPDRNINRWINSLGTCTMFVS